MSRMWTFAFTLLALAAGRALVEAARPEPPPFEIEAGEDVAAQFPGAPRIQSFAIAEWGGRWILLAGRIAGYHGEGGKDADFPRSGANDRIWVLEPPAAKTPARTFSIPVSQLPARLAAVKDQLLSTNPQYAQRGETLYLAGGYGQNSSGAWVTHRTLTALHLPTLVEAVVRQGDASAGIRYSESEHVQVTGGEMLLLDDDFFYLAGGHRFMGSYRDFEATGGQNQALASQQYSAAIRKLRIDASTLKVDLVESFTHPEFRRRDLNASHVILPDGKTLGAALYGGVFTADQRGFSKPVYWTARHAPEAIANFNQKMSAYSCAHLALFDPVRGQMLTTFFGGISGWIWNQQRGDYEPAPREGDRSAATYRDGLQWIDRISTLVRDRDGAHTEFVQKEHRLAGYIGANAVFLPAPALRRLRPGVDVFDLRPLRGKRVLAGYIFGGIRAFPKQFPYSDDSPDYRSGNVPTRASEMVIAVYITTREIRASM